MAWLAQGENFSRVKRVTMQGIGLTVVLEPKQSEKNTPWGWESVLAWRTRARRCPLLTMAQCRVSEDKIDEGVHRRGSLM